METNGTLKLDAPEFHYHALHSQSSFHYVPRLRSSQTVLMNYDVVEYSSPVSKTGEARPL